MHPFRLHRLKGRIGNALSALHEILIIGKTLVRKCVGVHDKRREAVAVLVPLTAVGNGIKLHPLVEEGRFAEPVRNLCKSVLPENLQSILIKCVRRREEKIRFNAVLFQDFLSLPDHLPLLFQRYSREFRIAVQRKNSAVPRRVNMAEAMHRDGKAILLKFLYIIPERRPVPVDVERLISAVRHHADKRPDAAVLKKSAEPLEFCKIHMGRMRFCRMRQPVLQHRCCGLKVLHQQDFQT